MLRWAKTQAGYESTGSTGRYYSLVKHTRRFRFAAGGGYVDQKIHTLAVLKQLAQAIEDEIIRANRPASLTPPPGA